MSQAYICARETQHLALRNFPICQLSISNFLQWTHSRIYKIPINRSYKSTTGGTMAPKTLTDLPPELQLTVVEQISKPSDLKNLCLSCKALRTDALPTLYGRVIIDLDNCALPSLNGWFLADNAGRAYTRCLIFRKAPSEDQNSAWRTMSIALQCLARDSLHQIGYVRGSAFLWLFTYAYP